jgi:hypothetical protein
MRRLRSNLLRIGGVTPLSLTLSPPESEKVFDVDHVNDLGLDSFEHRNGKERKGVHDPDYLLQIRLKKLPSGFCFLSFQLYSFFCYC